MDMAQNIQAELRFVVVHKPSFGAIHVLCCGYCNLATIIDIKGTVAFYLYLWLIEFMIGRCCFCFRYQHI